MTTANENAANVPPGVEALPSPSEAARSSRWQTLRALLRRTSFAETGLSVRRALNRLVGDAALPEVRSEPEVWGRHALWLAVAFYTMVIIARAWVSDDGFISLRAVENLLGGYGLVSNPGERVQGFTNPLWVLLLAAVRVFGMERLYACLWTSVIVSVIAVGLVGRKMARSPVVGALAVVALACSQAFTDYSTSGLENPLSHLLLVAFFSIALNHDRRARNSGGLWLLAGLIATNRLDALVVVLPILAALALEGPWRRTLKQALLGFTPLFVWEAFSLVYYGFLLPNTAYAKLGVDIPRAEMMRQGGAYLLDAFERDPLTISIIVAALVLGLRRQERFVRLAAIGLALQLGYVVWVAGDFMAGRFLTIPLVTSVCVLLAVQPAAPARRWLGAVAGALAVVVVLSPHRPFKTEQPAGTVPPSGIIDERAYYFDHTSLSHNLRVLAYQEHPWFVDTQRLCAEQHGVVTHSNAGLPGCGAGSNCHVVDLAGLTDPLLARIPFKYRLNWRVGHYGRDIPPGYLETLRTGRNVIADAKIRSYFDKLHLVTSGPIVSWERWVAIAELNLGLYDDLLR